MESVEPHGRLSFSAPRRVIISRSSANISRWSQGQGGGDITVSYLTIISLPFPQFAPNKTSSQRCTLKAKRLPEAGTKSRWLPVIYSLIPTRPASSRSQNKRRAYEKTRKKK